MQGVVARIDPDPRGRVHAARPIDLATPAALPPRRPAVVSPQPDVPDLDEAVSYVAPGVDRRELKKLRRGDYAPTDRIDLHGLKSASAIATVDRFVSTRRARHRVVAIVHGRGLRSTDNVAVLRPKVRAHLAAHAGVLAYTAAPPSDGGDGVTYVLLKRT